MGRIRKSEIKRSVSLVLIELNAGSVCVGLRYGKSPFVRIIKSLEDLSPDVASQFVVAVAHGDIPIVEVCAMESRLVELPASFWQSAKNDASNV